MKKILSTLLALTMILGMSATAFAAEPTASEAPKVQAQTSSTVSVLNDPALMQKYDETYSTLQNKAARFGLTLKNRKSIGQRFYDDSPFIVDTIEGPLAVGPKLKFEATAKAGHSGDCGVSKSGISASFGVDFSYEETVTRTYQFDPVPKGKMLTYKCYVNYTVYEFEVYKGDTKLGTSKYWTPVGVVVTQNLK